MKANALRPCWCGVGLVLLLGCSGSPNQLRVTSARDLPPASGQPEITQIRDLSLVHLARGQTVSAAVGDGMAVVGELILIEGEGFGRRPRATVGGQTATVVGRTARGAVIARIPWGARPGNRPVAVITRKGKATRRYLIGRYVLATVPSRDQVVPLLLGADGKLVRRGKPLVVPNAHLVRFASEGHLALVSGATEKGELTLHLVDMAAAGQPRILKSYGLPGSRLRALSSAVLAPRACVITDTHIVFIDFSKPLQPALTRPQPLPEAIASTIVAADIGPRGERLALLLRANELKLYDVKGFEPMREIASAKVLPRAPVPLVRAVRYGADSRTIWVISGDNLRSVWRGRFPLRLTVIRIHHDQQEAGRARSFGVLSVWRTLDIPYRAAPVDLAVARGQPLATGRTVAVPPDNAAVFITAHDSKLLRLRRTRFDRARGLRRAVKILRGIRSHVGTLLRSDSSGHGGPMFTSPSLLGSIDVTSDSQWLLVAGTRVETRRKPASLQLVYGVSVSRVWGKPNPSFMPLAEADPETLARPFLLGDIQVQP